MTTALPVLTATRPKVMAPATNVTPLPATNVTPLSATNVTPLPATNVTPLQATNETKWPKTVRTAKQNPSMTQKADMNRCRVGYRLIEKTCIRLSLQTKGFYSAQRTCKREGATLAMPKTEELDIALRKLVLEGRNGDIWIGLKDVERFRLQRKYRKWQWLDGSALEGYKGWGPEQPNDKRLKHFKLHDLCVRYWLGSKSYPMWNDTKCHGSKGFICQALPAKLYQKILPNEIKYR
ncbi:C-type lectin 1-like [Branchiostoma floridae x Branchiostoma japonicum]